MKIIDWVAIWGMRSWSLCYSGVLFPNVHKKITASWYCLRVRAGEEVCRWLYDQLRLCAAWKLHSESLFWVWEACWSGDLFPNVHKKLRLLDIACAWGLMPTTLMSHEHYTLTATQNWLILIGPLVIMILTKRTITEPNCVKNNDKKMNNNIQCILASFHRLINETIDDDDDYSLWSNECPCCQ